MNTRSIVLDARNEFIVPTVRNRLTFDNQIDDEVDFEPGLITEAMKDNYHMYPLLTRRALGSTGLSNAFLLTPGIAKNPARTLNWRRSTFDAIKIQVSNGVIDEEDNEIFQRTVARFEAGEIKL